MWKVCHFHGYRGPSASSHGPGPAALLMAVAVLVAVAGIAGSCLVSCLSPAQMVAEGPQIVADMSAACPALTAIPLAGPFVAAACQGAEAEVAAAVAQAKAELAAQGGADAGALDAATLRPLRRHGHVVGYCSACLWKAAQAHLDAMADAGAPAATSSRTTSSTTDAGPVDGGSEGGR